MAPSKAKEQKQTSKKPATPTEETVTDVLAVAVLDRSQSMDDQPDEPNKRSATIEMWNSYLTDMQTDDSGTTWLILVAFDHLIEIWEDGTLVQDVPLLNNKTYVPRGSTALNDAIAHGIFLADEKLKTLDGGVKVLMPILTDGQENCSRQYPGRGNPALKSLMAERAAQGNFTFTFLSADPTETSEAVMHDYGVPVGNFASFAATPDSMKTTGQALSTATRGLRSNAVNSTQSLYSDAGLGNDFTNAGTNAGQGEE